MEKINNLLDTITEPFTFIANFIVRIGLGISFFLHGFGKLPINQGFIDFLSSKGVPLSNIFAYLVAWGEILAGLGIILGGLLIKLSPSIANIITKISGLTIVIIMINALLIAHSNWSIFIGERGSILFASEQLFLLILGFFFFIRGNRT
ncbi:MAG: DoxX family protein [Alphaproteobacteria bacterium]